MDKRTLLALGLSFLVFLVWSILYAPKPTERKVDKQIKPKRELEESVVKDRIMPSGQKRDLILDVARGFKDIKVETELYTAIFSGSRPLIKSFRLKKYLSKLEKDFPLKELVHVKNKDGYGFSVEPGQSTPNINWATHKTSPQGITIRPGDQPKELIYESESPQGMEIQTRFLFYADTYKIDLSVAINNRSEYTISLLLNMAHFPQETKKSYYAFEGMSLLRDNKLEQVKVKKLKDKQQYDGRISWIAYEEPYFMTAIINEKNEKATAKGTIFPNGEVRISYMPPSLNLRPGENIMENFTLYLGPRDLDILKAINKNLEKAINYGFFHVIAKPLLLALRFFYDKVIPNYGVSIILLTIIIKILFWPLTHKSYQSMKEMRKLQPIMAKIREKYKGNKQEMNKQLMSLYKTYKINPMGGCLPMIIQIPVFFALFRVLPTSIELRHAPFILWIKDLSAPDRLFSFPIEKIPFMAPPYGIPVLTLIMGASMFLQQKMTPTTGDPAQAKMMMLLPIVFTFLFINFPSGLVLYWLVNNILSIAQQYRINRQSS
jgi:YidC/Oxa1 family membrane protein insertase